MKGNDLRSVNALSFALPYDQSDYEFVGVEPLNMKAMENLTYDRLHTNGVKSLYPTFVNMGKQEALEGSEELFILKLKAKRKVKFDLNLKDGILVDKQLRMHSKCMSCKSLIYNKRGCLWGTVGILFALRAILFRRYKYTCNR